MKRRGLMILAAACLSLGLFAGCGSSQTAGGSGQEPEGGSASAVQGTESPAEGSSEAEGTKDSTESATGAQDGSEGVEMVGEYVIPEVKIGAFEVPETEAFAFVRSLKIGWNLGNTFDAFSDRKFADELEGEKQWVGVITTKEMIEDIRGAGFNAVRIPVSWHDHVDQKYQISQVWLDRVQEVVDYAYDSGMYVILNIHHDNSEEFLYPSTQYLDQSLRYVKAIWKQLADRFAEYDEHLIFECMNEPRQVGTAWEWWLNGSEEAKDAVSCINVINQAFVDTVRGTGGSNRSRYLMTPGYCASPDGALNEGFVFPTDAEGVTDKLILSAHAYTPYNFALQPEGESGSVSDFKADSTGSTKDIVYFMDNLYNRFVKNGIPVVIGEFGARDKGGNTQSRVDFATYYVAAARARGMSCFWWDNNIFEGNGERFGIYDRQKRSFPYPEIIAGLMKYAD